MKCLICKQPLVNVDGVWMCPNPACPPCPHNLTVTRSPIGSAWLIICLKCRKSWGPYNYEVEAKEKMEEITK